MTTYTYDAGPTLPVGPVVSYTYDGTGRLLTPPQGGTGPAPREPKPPA